MHRIHTSARVVILFKNPNARSSPSSFEVWTNTGIIAPESAPSPKSRLNKFGSVNAKVYALLTAPMPIYAMLKESRTSPSAREPTVANATLRMFLSFPTAVAFLFSPAHLAQFAVEGAAAYAEFFGGFCPVAVGGCEGFAD